jgi:ubiquinone/menaquinone biosynthesis C-methylase UbiE
MNKAFEVIQSEFFDKIAESFTQTPPELVLRKIERIIQLSEISEIDKVFDIGTGQGILIPYFQNKGVEDSKIIACDLSSEMIRLAKNKFPNIKFLLKNANDFSLNEIRLITQIKDFAFTRIFFNACFGNFTEPQETLKKMRVLLNPQIGRIIISHPLGSKFVSFLNQREPHIVPNLLPEYEDIKYLSKSVGLEIKTFISEEEFYFCQLSIPS